MDAVTTHGDVEGRTCRRRRIRRCKLNSPVRWQIEHDHSIRHGADPAPEHVLATYEAGDIGGQRLGVHVVGGRSLFDVAVIHDHDQVRQRDRFRLRVRHVDEGDAEVALHAPQFAAHLQTQELVERRLGLVEEQYPRIGDQRARFSLGNLGCWLAMK